MSVTDTIEAVASSLGLDPRLAVADATVESGLNPQAVGDNGTSFGLYQLHQGGELGSLSPQQAFDPATNAHVALSTMAQVARQHPDWSPGQIAAAAQRPADPTAYAAKVNQAYAQLAGTVPNTPDATLTGWHLPGPLSLIPGAMSGLIPGLPSGVPNPIGGVTSGIAGDVASGIQSGVSAAAKPFVAYLPRLLAIVGGIILFFVAVKVTFGGSVSGSAGAPQAAPSAPERRSGPSLGADAEEAAAAA